MKKVFAVASIILSLLLLNSIELSKGFESAKLPALADTYVTTNNPLTNYGGQDHLVMSGTVDGGVNYIFLKFDMTNIPSDAKIIDAYLMLYTAMATSTYSVTASYLPNNDWSETGVTFADYPEAIDSSNVTDRSPTYQLNSTVDVSKAYEWYFWNATDALQSALNKSEKAVSFELRSDYQTGFHYIWFYSKDQISSLTEEYAPKVILTYQIQNAQTDSSTPSPSVPEMSAVAVVTALITISTVAILYKRKH